MRQTVRAHPGWRSLPYLRQSQSLERRENGNRNRSVTNEKAERLPVRQLDRLVDWRERGWALAGAVSEMVQPEPIMASSGDRNAADCAAPP
jgi:hypothetical protein